MDNTITITEEEREKILKRVERRLYDELLEKAEESIDTMSPARVAGKLDVSLATLGKLPIPKVDLVGNGKLVRYKVSAVEEHLNKQTIKS